MAKRIQLRRDIRQNWEDVNPKLAQGEIGVDLSLKNFKIGDGISTWNDLDYAIITGKLGRVNEDTYIETGDDSNNSDAIYFVNNGEITVELTPELKRVFVATLFDNNEADPISSTSPTTGMVVVRGGVGITEDLNVGGTIDASNLTVNEATILNRIFGNIQGTLFGNVVLTDTTDNTAGIYTSNGTKILSPGTGITPPLYTGNVNGNINSTSSSFDLITVNGGSIDGTTIGSNTPANMTGVIVTATNKFVGKVQGDLIGDVYAQDGTTKIIENSTTGSGATFYGTLVGSTAGDFRGDIFAENSNRKVLENGRGNLPSDANFEHAVFFGNVGGNITSDGVSTFSNIEVNGGRIDNTSIGKNIPAEIVGTTIIATEVFIGQFEGIITGSSTGDVLSAEGVKILENGTDGTNAYLVGDVRAKDGDTTILNSGLGWISTGTLVNSGNFVVGQKYIVLTQGTIPTDFTQIGSISNTVGTLFTATGVGTGNGQAYLATYLPATYTGNVVGNVTGNITATTISTATLTSTGNVSLGANLSVAGDANITGNINAQNFNVTGTSVAISGTKFTIQSATGDTNIAGNLTVGGNTTFTGNLDVTDITANDINAIDINASTVTTTGNISVGDDISVTNDLAVGGNANITGITSSDSFDGNLLDIDNIRIDGNTIKSTTGEIKITTATATDYLNISSRTFNVTYNNTQSISMFDMTGDLTVDGNLDVTGDANITGNITAQNFTLDGTTLAISGTKFTIQSATGDTNIAGDLTVDGDTTLKGDLNVQGSLTYLNTTNTEITDNIIILNKGEIGSGVTSGSAGIEVDRGTSDNAWLKWNETDDLWEFGINGAFADLKLLDLFVTGDAQVDGDLTTTGDITINDLYAQNINVTANANIGADLQVTGVSQFTGNMTAGDITADNISVTANVDITGTLDVTGLSTFASVDINGGNIDGTKIGENTPDTIKATNVEVDSLTINNAGEIRLKETTAGGNTYVGLKAPNVFVNSYTLTLPAVKGIDGNVLAFNADGDKLEFVSADLFGGGQVAVSADNGNDLNDGINKPVKTIKRALQIASGLVYDSAGRVNGKRLVIAVASGEYYEDNPIIIPDNVSVVGAGLRACNIRPLNNGKDMLRVRNGCYFTEITFRDALNIDGKPVFTFNYAVAFDDPSDTFTSRTGYTYLPTSKPTITISPYVQNCSIISFLGGNGVLVDGNKVKVPNLPLNAIEAELTNNTLPGVPQQGKSMVANAFTMLSFGGTGWRVINDAYAQIVSCFQIFCLNGSYCQSGGYLSITNSATNFGQYALRASGYSPNAFEFNRGFVVATSSFLGQDVITAIGFKELPNPHYVTRFRDPTYKQAYDIINSYKEELAADLITWIDTQVTNGTAPFLNTFTYNQAKCSRDAKIVLEAVAYDTLSGGNSKLVEAALSYSEANSITLNFQKEENVAAFTRLRDITLPYVTATGLSTIVEAKFNLFISVLNDPTTAPDVIETTNIGDITANHILTSINDIVSFDSTTIDTTNNVIVIPGHGLTNMSKVVYSNNGNRDIPGLDNEQAYYVDLLNANQIRLYTDESQSKLVDILGLGTGTHRLLKNVREYFVDDVLTYHKTFQKLTLPSSSYTFIPGLDINGTTLIGSVTESNHAYVLSWDSTTRELVVAIDVAAQSPDFLVTSIIGGDHSGTPIPGGITPTNVVSVSDYYSATFKVGSTFGSALLENKIDLPGKQIWLHRPSICNSSSHTWEYAGSGIDYNALPQNGGTTKIEYQQVSDLPGRVYTSGTNELGDFLVGDFIKAENKTGNVIFTNTVSIGELDALKLSINDIVIEEFSIDVQLGDSEPGGPKDTRISTQKAVRSYIQNKLSPFLDREVTTNNLAGAIPQLNSLGLLNPDMIPPIRNFLVWKTNGYGSRLTLKDTVPSSNVLPADLSTETYSTVDIVLNTALTADDLTLVTQTSSGAVGYLVGNIVSSNVITIASQSELFDVVFDTSGPLTINGQSYTLNTGVGITTIGTILTNQTSNYVLSEVSPSQMLLLDTTATYDFTGVDPVTGAITKAQGYINDVDYPPTGLELGVIAQVDNIAKINGSGYVNGVYKNTSLTNVTGTGSGAVATITVLNGQVTTVEMVAGGTGYAVGDLLSASLALQSGAPGGFSIPVLKIENRLHIDNVGGVKFSNNQDPDLKDYIQDALAPSASISQTGTVEITFDANNGVNSTPGVDTITIPNHGLLNGDPVRYDPVGQVEIGGTLQGPQANTVYYVKYIDADTIQLYTNYTLLTQERVALYSSGQGTQKLIISNIDLINNTIFLAAHGYLKGTALKITGTALPVGFDSGQIYYVGSVTTNSFTLHDDKIDADNSYDGVITEAKDLQNKPTGTMTFTKLNIRVDGAINTSSKLYANWSGLSANNIAANNIISGIISPSRLGSLAANNTTFLRGDSIYAPVVQNITKPTDSALTILGNFTTNASNINEYTNSVSLDVDVVDGSEARATPGGFQWTNLGVARFNRSQFDVGTGAALGQVTIKPLVVNAGLLNNANASYYLDSSNHTIQPVNKGGTGISTYTPGDMLYASTNSILDFVQIGSPYSVLQVSASGAKPEWTDTLRVSGLIVNGDIDASGAKSTFNAYDIKMDDNNIELGSVDPVYNREGVINYTGGGSLTTEVTIPLANNGTKNLIPGMTITKVIVPGQPGLFGNDSKILSVDSATQITVIGTTIPTSGAVRFNAGGASDDTANNGGLTIKSTVNKTLAWKKNTGAWTSSENMDLDSGKTYMINNTTVLSANTVLGKELSSDAGKIMTSGSTWIRTFAFMGV